MKKSLFVFLSILLFVSCDNDEPQNNEFDPIEINFTEIGKGTLSGSGQENISQSNLIIQNQAEWQSLMDDMNSIDNDITSVFSETEIDFENYTIIAVFLEVKNNGWEIEINSIIENENNINISTQETESDTLVMTQPFYIAKISNSDKTIIFE